LSWGVIPNPALFVDVVVITKGHSNTGIASLTEKWDMGSRVFITKVLYTVGLFS